MAAALQLPSYRDQSPEVAARFDRLRQRPVALEVVGLTKTFETTRGTVTALVGAETGEVKVSGQVWEARPYDPTITIEPGEPIEVFGLDGITLIVYPVHRSIEG